MRRKSNLFTKTEEAPPQYFLISSDLEEYYLIKKNLFLHFKSNCFN